jgi:hypothetical protein
MKSTRLTVLATLAIFLALSLVSSYTLIAGKVYNHDFSETISGATVKVTCNGNEQIVTSLSDGAYAVKYPEVGEGSCNNGNTVEVYANKSNLHGSSSGLVYDDVIDSIDVAVVNVPLIPEFGLLIGSLTVISAVALFLIVRRK